MARLMNTGKRVIQYGSHKKDVFLPGGSIVVTDEVAARLNKLYSMEIKNLDAEMAMEAVKETPLPEPIEVKEESVVESTEELETEVVLPPVEEVVSPSPTAAKGKRGRPSAKK